VKPGRDHLERALALEAQPSPRFVWQACAAALLDGDLARAEQLYELNVTPVICRALIAVAKRGARQEELLARVRELRDNRSLPDQVLFDQVVAQLRANPRLGR